MRRSGRWSAASCARSAPMPVEVPFFDRVATPPTARSPASTSASRRAASRSTSRRPSNPTGRVLAPGVARGARRAGAPPRPLDALRRGVRGLRLPRRARLDRGARARAHAHGVLVLEEPTAWRATASAISPVRPRRSPRRTSCQSTRATTRRPPRSSPRCARSRAAATGWRSARVVPHGRPRGRGAARRCPPPRARCFLFVDVAARLDERGLAGFLDDCFADGVVVAPGASRWRGVRELDAPLLHGLPPDDAAEGVRRLGRAHLVNPDEPGAGFGRWQARDRAVARATAQGAQLRQTVETRPADGRDLRIRSSP